MQTSFSHSQARRARARVASDLRSLAHSAEQLLEATAEDVSDKARMTRKQLRAVIGRVRDRYDDWQERGLATARSAVQKTDRTVRAKPYQSLAVVFGIGLIVGWLIRSGRDD